MDSRSKDEMKKEAFVMKELSHPCIVRLYGVSQSRKMNSTLMVLRKFAFIFILNGLFKCLIYLFRIILTSTANPNIAHCFGYWFKQSNTFYSLTIIFLSFY
jgi:hypothetical protein